MKKVTILISLIVCIVLVSAPAFAQEGEKSWGQTVFAAMNHNCLNPYEPDYPIDPEVCTWSINTRLIIRNVDLEYYMYVYEINIHDPDGNFVTNLLAPPTGDPPTYLPIAPLASVTFAVPHGPVPYWSAVFVGRPSFIVKWSAHNPEYPCCPEAQVHQPMVSSAHVIMSRGPDWRRFNNGLKVEGLSTTQGVVLEEHDEPQDPQ